MKIGIAADHGGYALKEAVRPLLEEAGHEVTDYGARSLDDKDDYPDYVIPLAEAVAGKRVDRGIAICGSGVGASIAANKVPGLRAALVHDHFSAHQGVEDDDMNMLCLGGRVVGNSVAEELIFTYLEAKFTGEERHERRLNKVKHLEDKYKG
ncbi:RpiB/LacA/LacB family sugar-phosphate isomerase [Pontibacter akesuensis]|uniref:Ribose 5-phosphate isomerase B n=1 Tax=Pontibacter akesuensis TaxID=388950 RepID=A0A1I7FV48_9BACT|nr:RpiB/LacA/LacB family sugar-phosphate isomerase [Pontibacter akesuensis]GHA60356.1 ribose-5-phosphate isomerase [Pontibacter akesuensis]SFU40043.1 ribose 5-phosphate isomerase B [Pontibacter akesuensis]